MLAIRKMRKWASLKHVTIETIIFIIFVKISSETAFFIGIFDVFRY